MSYDLNSAPKQNEAAWLRAHPTPILPMTAYSKETARWLAWSQAGDHSEPEPPYPLEWMDTQTRSEHMEATAFPLVESALDVSAPLSEVIEVVAEMYEIRVKENQAHEP